MEAEQVPQLLDSIVVVRKMRLPRKHGGAVKDVVDIKGLRDRAVIANHGLYFRACERRCGFEPGDYRHEGKRAWLRLVEKGTKEKLVWLHREAEEFLDGYIKEARPDDARLLSSSPLTKGTG